MKVAICNVQEFDPMIGGIERVSVSLADSLIKFGIEILFIACLKSPYSKEYKLPAKQYFLPDTFDYSTKNVECFSDIVRKYHVDIILNQNSHSELYNRTCFEVKKKTGVKLISVYHFTPNMRIRANRNIVNFKFLALKSNLMNCLRTLCTYPPLRYVTMYDQRRLFRNMYEYSDKIVLLSRAFFGVYKYESGLKDVSKLVAINNMLSFPLQENTYKKKKQLLYCSRLAYGQKRPDRILYIWKLLQNKLPDWNLKVVGDGPLKTKMEEISVQMNLHRISFEGFQNPIPFYKESSIFCMTSNHEGWGLVLTEAMQFGCVPVAFNSYESVGDIIEHGKNGFLVKPFDIKQYAEQVKYLAESNIEEYSLNAIKSVERFNPINIARDWVILFKNVLGR